MAPEELRTGEGEDTAGHRLAANDNETTVEGLARKASTETTDESDDETIVEGVARRSIV